MFLRLGPTSVHYICHLLSTTLIQFSYYLYMSRSFDFFPSHLFILVSSMEMLLIISKSDFGSLVGFKNYLAFLSYFILFSFFKSVSFFMLPCSSVFCCFIKAIFLVFGWIYYKEIVFYRRITVHGKALPVFLFCLLIYERENLIPYLCFLTENSDCLRFHFLSTLLLYDCPLYTNERGKDVPDFLINV